MEKINKTSESKYNNTTGTNYVEKISKIAFIMFVIIVLANIIIYPLSLNDTEMSGAYWFFWFYYHLYLCFL